MKKIFYLFIVLLSVCQQSFGQQYINIYQDAVVIKQLSTDEVDSMSVTETEPRIVSFWFGGEVFLTYNSAEIDSITVTNRGGAPLSYIGIVGFNSELKTKNIGILSSFTKSQYKSFVSDLPRKDGTILYYAVDSALNMLDNANIETPLKSVNVVTFTDGLDQGSLMLTDKYSSSADYLNALSGRIGQIQVADMSPTFYSVGLRGNDVSNVTLFRQNLQQLASSSENVFELSTISNLRSKFQDIANQIISVSTRQTMSVKVPGVDDGTRMRFVFDGKAAASSELYIEGTFRIQDRCLHDVTYQGIKAVSGKTVQGTQDGIFLTYTFTGMRREAGTALIPTSSVKQYYMYPSSTSWQINSEFSPASSSQRSVSHSGTCVFLILDCSSSLGSDFSRMQQYANEFIDLIADNAEPFELLPPKNVKAALDDTDLVVNVSWDAVKNAQSYNVYRSNSSNGIYTIVAEGITSTSWTDNNPNLLVNQVNSYKISAVLKEIESELSNAAGVVRYEASEYVDLGLPSGTLWATCNIGASSPEDYGDYFAWGETKGYNSGKENFDESTYKWYNGSSSSITKYNYWSNHGVVDNKKELDLEDDAAYVNWGSEWRMPSEIQFDELINSNYTTIESTTLNGVLGHKITSKKNGNSIFLPEKKGYWSRTLSLNNPKNAHRLLLASSVEGVLVGVLEVFNSRNYDFYVRPVRISANQPTNVKAALDDTDLVVNVSWEAVKDVQSYNVYRSNSSNGIYTIVAEGITSTSWTDNNPNLLVNQVNSYKISAVLKEIESELSNAAGVVRYEASEYVDLGLPSGTLWATCNIGASSPEDYGDYFAWGETKGYNSGKKEFSRSTYKWNLEGLLIKYCTKSSEGVVDNKEELDLEDDAAYVNWGSEWRMPSKEQFKELISSKYTTTEWTFQNEVLGYKITSKKNGKSIFLPAAGWRQNGLLIDAGTFASYYGPTLAYSSHTYDCILNTSSSSNISFTTSDYIGRAGGFSVRPVRR